MAEAAEKAMSEPLVAIVGRPNVGKSTLFNRLVGARQAIVEDRPGVTRDRLYGVAEWEAQQFLVVDTGGLDPSGDEGLIGPIREQVQVAIEEADLILFVVDALSGLTSDDITIAEQLRRGSAARSVLLVANKADSDRREIAAWSVHELGLGDVYPVSAAHGRGVAELCEAIVERIPATPEVTDPMPPGIRLAFLGRPNAGKSTLVNTLIGDARMIVDAVPGTTHDPVALPLRWRDEDLVIIDTAGLRRRKQVARAMEKLAAIKAIRTMERTQVVVLVIDSENGVTDQDQRIARMAFDRGKGVVVLLHKWDRITHDKKRAHEALEQAQTALAFLEHPYIIKTSVVGDGRDVGKGRAHNLDEALAGCVATAKSLERRIATSDLNDALQDAVAAHSPPTFRGQPVRLYFMTQADTSPPLLVISANRGRCLTPAYERFLLRRIRTRWHLRGIPLRLVVRGRKK